MGYMSENPTKHTKVLTIGSGPPGYTDVIQGPWLMDQMKGQAEVVGTEMIQDHIASVDLKSKPFKAVGDSGQIYEADSIIISTGAQARWLNIDSEQNFRG